MDGLLSRRRTCLYALRAGAVNSLPGVSRWPPDEKVHGGNGTQRVMKGAAGYGGCDTGPSVAPAEEKVPKVPALTTFGQLQPLTLLPFSPLDPFNDRLSEAMDAMATTVSAQ
jgi:hypothetical protein